ncbi:alpha/beta hydrolase domain-containing protein VTE7 [Cornus florida]|uniref:alpha/beta hydrolase domain-containing protein VTE7 n=1 Tax=Cornus florida TaxID=4283 RepID=UPI00289AD0DB|nr:alpha/beta hydrolase domain-containing protein VTE7 [Cornus florida]XP_059648770.1 alpha/beta hydrolase domain-containing protein VTE7 [Cornus florida]XP_059648771.1 alpha/beta hydrolase domain-containing protein VTE7 [Cornus florida]
MLAPSAGEKMMLTALSSGATLFGSGPIQQCQSLRRFRVSADGFPSFLPKEVERINDPFARKLAARIQRLPVQVSFSESSIMSSCVKPLLQTNTNPVVLLHGFDSSCLEWRYTLPLLEEAGLETWAVDVLGWGFSDLERLPSCNVASKRNHLYQFWKSYIKRPMILVGPSLGAAVAIDFVVHHSEAVDKLVLIDASVYTEGTGNSSRLPQAVAYAGVYLLKSIPLRLYATYLAFNGLTFSTSLDWTNVGRLHCLLPWWENATINFMNSGGYDVSSQIEQVKQKTLIIWGEEDQIISNKLAVRLHCELPNAIIRQIPGCGHIPHVEKPTAVAKFILEFVQDDC